MDIKTSKGTWQVHGICLTPSDSIYQKIVEAIETGNVNQTYLQGQTGHRAPILVDLQRRRIDFERF